MGCDIHLFIEYREHKDAEQWDSLSFRDLILRRNYRTFAAMAGVRQCDDFKVDFQPPRGLPKDHSFHAGMANQLYVVDRRDHIGNDEASKFDVEKWISQGLSRWIDEDYVTHPDSVSSPDTMSTPQDGTGSSHAACAACRFVTLKRSAAMLKPSSLRR